MATDGASPMSQARQQQASETDGNAEAQSLVDRIRGARERVQRAEQSKRAKRRAKARRGQMDDGNGGSQTVQEAKGLASDAKELISTEFGVDEDDAADIIEQGQDLLSSAGEQLSRLDADGDGDTDILTALEDSGAVEATTDARSRQGGRVAEGRVEPPVGDVEDDFDQLDAEGVEAELGLDFPIEDDL